MHPVSGPLQIFCVTPLLLTCLKSRINEMGIERVEMILSFFMCKHRQTTFGPTRAPPLFICIVLHQFAKLNDNNPPYSGAELSQVLRYILLNLMGAELFIFLGT